MPPNTKSEVPISHHSFWEWRGGGASRIEQKSHSTFDVLKKQLKKYIYLKFKKQKILQKRQESSSEENWGDSTSNPFVNKKHGEGKI